ncbi:hypothetical protein [Reichenbachiella sp. MALMAid0571]|uniref:hypothetical protein n=1 Tax=Reichenbachiella sp. MALMAid0571 TaxID=3143939 RepID=UPI0032DFD91D
MKAIFSNFYPLNKFAISNIPLLLLLVLSCNQQTQKIPFNHKIKVEKTVIKGKVDNWPTDTLYFASLPFHSPYSTFEGFHLLRSNKTFEHTFDRVDEPFILFLTPEKRFLDQRSFLLFEGFTKEYYHGYCKNFFTMPITTYLIEPGSETIVELSKTSRYGQTEINFLNENIYCSKYYQTTFELDQRLDEVITMANTVEKAIDNMNQKEKELLTSLKKESAFISPFLYNFTKAEIEFAARKEFLRYLLLDHPDMTSKFFENGIPANITERIEFDKENIDYATLISQEYNEFLELYINFKYSEMAHKLVVYKEFDKEKYELASSQLPPLSKYSYLANNLLHSNMNQQTKTLSKKLIEEYPDGELNDKLLNKYN